MSYYGVIYGVNAQQTSSDVVTLEDVHGFRRNRRGRPRHRLARQQRQRRRLLERQQVRRPGVLRGRLPVADDVRRSGGVSELVQAASRRAIAYATARHRSPDAAVGLLRDQRQDRCNGPLRPWSVDGLPRAPAQVAARTADVVELQLGPAARPAGACRSNGRAHLRGRFVRARRARADSFMRSFPSRPHPRRVAPPSAGRDRSDPE